MLQRMEQTHTQKNLRECLADESCPVCHGTGWEIVEDGGQGTGRECSCGLRQRQIMNNRLSFACIPEAFKDVKIENFNVNAYENENSRNKAATALNAIRYWLNDFGSMHERGMGLYLYSEAKGSGKTRMAASIANELMHEKHMQVKFATSLQILNEIKASWDARNKEECESERTLLDHLAQAAILIIDDFGIEQAKDWIVERFYQIINSRYVDKRITIFTSNARLDMLRYDARITNRIKEMSFQIPFPEESVRDSIAKQNMNELVQGIKSERK